MAASQFGNSRVRARGAAQEAVRVAPAEPDVVVAPHPLPAAGEPSKGTTTQRPLPSPRPSAATPAAVKAPPPLPPLRIKRSNAFESSTKATRPVAVRAVAAGAYCSFAVTVDGSMWGWGCNSWGELGNGTTEDVLMPTRANGLPELLSVSAFGHAVALGTDGAIWAWGRNECGQTGLGDSSDLVTRPAHVTGISAVRAVGVGDASSFAVTRDGSLFSWGVNHARITEGEYIPQLNHLVVRPERVSGLPSVDSAAAGRWHTLALANDGTVWAWGRNDYGQLGIGNPENRRSPTVVAGLPTTTAISTTRAGPGWGGHSLARALDGSVWAWGDNRAGQLGDGTTMNRFSPVRVEGLPTVRAVACGVNFSFALADEGSVWFWGLNREPFAMGGFPAIESISAGGDHLLALADDGTVWAWGTNRCGKLGDGSTEERTDPVRVEGIGG